MKNDLAAFVRIHFARFINELQDFIRFPSVSVDPRRAHDVKRCAVWLARKLRHAGLRQVRIYRTGRHPVVYAEWYHAPGKPTVLIYGHYDVQPADPLNEWKTPPFEPTVRGEDLYGRGSSDDKGQLFIHVKALEAWLRTAGRLPVNVKCLFEGEEEIGSPNLAAFLRQHQRELRADAAIMSDTQMPGPGQPVLNYGLRGQLGLELKVHGLKHDLHSGNFGGIAHDPLQVLSEILARLHDTSGHIAIPGFYDRVRPPGQIERAYMKRFGPSDAELLQEAALKQGWGECGYSLYERLGIRPSLTINGLAGGHVGPGGKSVIPSSAVARMDIRLVPDQDPREIELLFRRHIRSIAPPTVKASVQTLSAASPALISLRDPAMRAAKSACRTVFGTAPVYLRCGGSIPAVNLFKQVLGISTVLMGFALPDDRAHAPNEKFHLPNFRRGIHTVLRFLNEFSRCRLPTMCRCDSCDGTESGTDSELSHFDVA